MLSQTSAQFGKSTVHREALSARQPWKARIRQVSPAGAYLLANRKMGAGSRLQLRVTAGAPITLYVTRCATQPTGGWALTCLFEGDPDEAMLHRLMPPPNPLDQRQWARLPCASLARF